MTARALLRKHRFAAALMSWLTLDKEKTAAALADNKTFFLQCRARYVDWIQDFV